MLASCIVLTLIHDSPYLAFSRAMQQPLLLFALITACLPGGITDSFVSPNTGGLVDSSSTPVLFRLGSGAVATIPVAHDLAKDWAESMEVIRLKSTQPEETTSVSEVIRLNTHWSEMSIISKSLRATKGLSPIFRRLRHLQVYILAFLSVAILMMMMPGAAAGPGSNFNYRIPPSWSPENDQSYSFRAFMTDISLWIMLTDLHPHQQCAAIIMRLGGSAREMARMITP